MNRLRLVRCVRLLATGSLLFGLGSCFGPNPGFFIGSTAAGATISTLVGSFINSVLSLGQG